MEALLLTTFFKLFSYVMVLITTTIHGVHKCTSI